MVLFEVVVVAACLCFGSATATATTKCVEGTSSRVDCYPPRANFPEPTEELCLAQGCCWKSLENGGIPCAFPAAKTPTSQGCANVPKVLRMACRNPRFASLKVLEDADTCGSIGCCFDDGECFQPMAKGYELLTLDKTTDGWRGTLALRHESHGPFGNDLALLELNVVRLSANQVRIRITDPAFPRYEVPDMPVRRQEENADEEQDFQVHFTPWPFGVAITRRHSGEVLFNSTPPVEKEEDGASFSGLIFENQFIEISTQLTCNDDDNPILYGLGERLGLAHLRADDEGDLYPMFARAPNTSAPVHTRDGGDNLYGVHPFILQLENGETGNAHGIFMLSSNAMEVVARCNALTYRLTGGILDVFVFSGPSPQNVVKQYTDVVGRPAMPPYWALGYQVGQRGGRSVDDAMKVVMQLRTAGIPMDAYWQDFKLMVDEERELPLEKIRALHNDMRAFVDDLHFHNQYFVCVQDPAVMLTNTSMPRERGDDVVSYNTGTNAKHIAQMLHTLSSETSEDVSFGERQKYDEEDYADTGSKNDIYETSSDSDDRSGETRRGDTSDTSSRDEERESSAEVEEEIWDPLERGKELDVFVKGINGERYAQKAFRSGWAVFVDFFHPKASRFWNEQLAMFHEYVAPFDGLWLDMNEPSSTCDCTLAAEEDICSHICNEHEHFSGGPPEGDEDVQLGEVTLSVEGGGFIRTSDVNFPFDPYRQPYAPGQNDPDNGGHGNLNSGTLPMAALHHLSLHYNLHSLYGHQQARITRNALDDIIQKRSMLLSRSTFSGSGRYAGHWLGDGSVASWEQLRLSISGTLQMNLLGIPLSGPNVCGTKGRSSRELYVRWHQAAAFLPLLRNYAESDEFKQSPVDFGADTLNILRSTLLTRYRYLPYMYTLFYEAHRSGNPVVRPLSFEFPKDKNARDIEYQYLLGSALMISPVVHEGAISTEVYFPESHWYDADSGKLALDSMTVDNRRLSLLTPLPKLQIHLRGGYIIPTQQPLTTTAFSRRGAVTLLAALNKSDESGTASGDLYIDDGDSLSAIEDHRYSLLHFSVLQPSSDTIEFKSFLKFHGYAGPEMHADIKEVRVYGVYGKGFAANSSMDATLKSSHEGSPNEHSVKADYFAQSNMLVISRLDVPIGQEFHVRVVAQPALPSGNGKKGKPVGANTSEKSGRESNDNDGEKAKKSKRKSKFSVTGIVGIVVGCAFLAAIILVILLRRRRRGYETV